MRWFNWKTVTATAAALAAGIGYAAGKGERYPAPSYVSELLLDLPAAAAKLEPHSPAREAIEAGELDRARTMLSFRPLDEAPVPFGFPPFTPVGVIEVKQYPAYRKAVGPGFWPLFQHITKRDIPMTTPVEMRGVDAADTDGAMAFLYQSTEVGQLGPADSVAVEDTPKTLAVSLGVRGKMTRQSAADARQRLQAWLADQNDYRIASIKQPFRVFGHNSPMVPETDRYWEAQLLLEPAPKP